MEFKNKVLFYLKEEVVPLNEVMKGNISDKISSLKNKIKESDSEEKEKAIEVVNDIEVLEKDVKSKSIGSKEAFNRYTVIVKKANKFNIFKVVGIVALIVVILPMLLYKIFLSFSETAIKTKFDAGSKKFTNGANLLFTNPDQARELMDDGSRLMASSAENTIDLLKLDNQYKQTPWGILGTFLSKLKNNILNS